MCSRWLGGLVAAFILIIAHVRGRVGLSSEVYDRTKSVSEVIRTRSVCPPSGPKLRSRGAPGAAGGCGCELDHRAMCSLILGCPDLPDSGGEDVSSSEAPRHAALFTTVSKSRRATGARSRAHLRNGMSAQLTYLPSIRIRPRVARFTPDSGVQLAVRRAYRAGLLPLLSFGPGPPRDRTVHLIRPLA
jgi:hypothetical protein